MNQEAKEILKYMGSISIFLMLQVIIPNSLAAQDNQLRCKWIKFTAEPFSLDSLSILPSTIQINSPSDTSLRVAYDLNTNQAQFTGSTLADSIQICYQVLPFNLAQSDFKRDVNAYETNEEYLDTYQSNDQLFRTERESVFELNGFNKSGSVTRGVTFGNNQNASVNSALNLQLDGPLSKDISILAAISDQNIPFQPEGNTQQLQDFDRIYVKLSHRYGSLTVGDVVLRNPENYFLRYYKNVQGGLLEAEYDAFENSKARSSLGIAVSKGRFASIQIEAEEGVQGPYRLQGPNNENFIIVLAGSEKVFIDGRLLQRGFNQDYVIDYNLGEIIFNNNVVITQFTRIRVDFEFSERNYSRSIIAANHEQSFGKFNIALNAYQASDNPRNPLIDLSSADINALSAIGDSVTSGIPGADSADFTNESGIFYKQIDTIGARTGETFRIFVFSSNPDSANFRVSFTEVGFNRGDYVRVNSTLNGQVYEWREPLNGIPQGDFAPIRVVPTPQRQQLFTVGLSYNLTEQEKFYTELAFSDRDFNRFSSINDEDNQGQAIKLGYINTGKDLKFIKDYQWQGHIDFEFDSESFTTIDRFRSIEFERNWSNNNDTSQVQDRFFNAGLGLQKDLNNRLNYSLSVRNRENVVQGLQQRASIRQAFNRLLLKFDMFLLNSTLSDRESLWQQFFTDIGYRLNFVTLGYRYNVDKNRVLALNTDSILAVAINFNEHIIYVQSADSSQVNFSADYIRRFDFSPVEGNLERRFASQTANFRLNTAINRSQNLAFSLTYREIIDRIDSSATQNNENNILGRIDWNGIFLDRHIRSELSFSTATGRELRREFAFVPVNTGEGTHTWRDNNNDGIQDLNEFFLAVNPDERNFIKVFVPTSNLAFIRAFNNNFIYRLNLEAPRNWRLKSGWKGFFGKFSNLTSWRINRRFTDNRVAARLIPFLQIAGENLLSSQEVLRSTLFFNRLDPSYGWEFSYQNALQRQFLTNGFDQTENQEFRIVARSNLGKNWNLRLTGIQGQQATQSDFLLERNYEIQFYQVSPELAFQPNRKMRIITTYNYSFRENRQNTEFKEDARSQQISIEARVNRLGKTNLLANIRYININFRGEENSPVGYELLQALQPGVNWTWTMNWQQRLANGLQVSLNYQGRKSPTSRTIHVARMQVTALF